MKNTKKNNLKNKKKTLKKMNCNPLVENKTVLPNSCLTKEVLIQIKNEYNKHHSKNPIVSTNTNDLWYSLKDRLKNCEKEDCWLEEIKDAKLRKQIDEMSFAPDKPPEWKREPNAWLSNYDILNVLKQYEKKYKCFRFIGPSPIDFDSRIPHNNNVCVWEEICNLSIKDYVNKNINKIGIIFNLDKHNESGSHWVSLFIDLKDKFIFYFDSNGVQIPEEIKILVDRIIEQGKNLETPILFDFYENYPFEHQQGNTECGMYSLFFIISMLTDKIGRKKINDYKDKIKYFKTVVIPDKYVFKYRNKYFNG